MDGIYYNNELTNEWGNNHQLAMKWFRTGAAVGLYKIDQETGELYKVSDWTW